MRILVDLHGGDPNNSTAIAEFKEIKDRVMQEVSYSYSNLCVRFVLTRTFSVTPGLRGHTMKCGRDIKVVFCLQCHLKHLRNLYVIDLVSSLYFHWHDSNSEWNQWYDLVFFCITVLNPIFIIQSFLTTLVSSLLNSQWYHLPHEISTYSAGVRRYKHRVFDIYVFTEHSIAAGWIGRDAILMAGINSLVYVLSTLPPWYLVDRWGSAFVFHVKISVLTIRTFR